MTQEQFLRLDKCHFQFDLSDICTEYEINARELLGEDRFDLYAILFYIDCKVKGMQNLDFAISVYKERTRSITAYQFKEDCNSEKQNFEAFLNALDLLITTYQNDTFDATKKLIPIDKNGTLIDGAHRVACAAYFDKPVRVLQFTEREVIKTTYSVMRSKMLPDVVSDIMALTACKWHEDLFMVFFWPKSAVNATKQQQALELIRSRVSVLYEREMTLNYNAIRNLMIQLYGHMDWVGSIENDFESTYHKASDVWDERGYCRFVLVRADSCEAMLKLKAEARDIMGIGLSSIHSTDTIAETNLAVNALFNRNSLHFISYAKPTKFKSSFKLVEKFKSIIVAENKLPEHYIIDSSMVLAIYGARQANDLDYYCLIPDDVLSQYDESIEEHDDTQKAYYDTSISDLILSPENYFEFNGLKFVSLENLHQFKLNRLNSTHDTKDKDDIVLIENLLSTNPNKFAIWRSEMSIKIRRFNRIVNLKYHITRNMILQKMGLYDLLKRLLKRNS
jgi:hypothetical protein